MYPTSLSTPVFHSSSCRATAPGAAPSPFAQSFNGAKNAKSRVFVTEGTKPGSVPKIGLRAFFRGFRGVRSFFRGSPSGRGASVTASQIVASAALASPKLSSSDAAVVQQLASRNGMSVDKFSPAVMHDNGATLPSPPLAKVADAEYDLRWDQRPFSRALQRDFPDLLAIASKRAGPSAAGDDSGTGDEPGLVLEDHYATPYDALLPSGDDEYAIPCDARLSSGDAGYAIPIDARQSTGDVGSASAKEAISADELKDIDRQIDVAFAFLREPPAPPPRTVSLTEASTPKAQPTVPVSAPRRSSSS